MARSRRARADRRQDVTAWVSASGSDRRAEAALPASPVKLVHFTGFRDLQRRANAERVFGPPDFIHPNWDRHALGDIAPDDLLVHAAADCGEEPRSFSAEAERGRIRRRRGT